MTGAAILTLIKLLPDLIDLVKKILGMIQAGVELVQIKQQLAKFGAAEDVAKQTKDTTDLEDMFHPKPPGT